MSVVVGRSRVATNMHRRRQPAAGSAGGRAGARARRQRGRRGDRDQRRDGSRRAAVERHRRRPVCDLYEARTGRLHGLNSHGWAPRMLTSGLLRVHGLSKMPCSGIHTVTVPGAVAGWDALVRGSARCRWPICSPRDLLRGRRVSGVGCDRRALGDADRQTRVGARSHGDVPPGGRAPLAGEVFRNPDLATRCA